MYCKSCKREVETNRIMMPEGYQHYAKLLCIECGTFLVWEKKPQNIGKRVDNNQKWRNMWHELNGRQYKCAICTILEEYLPLSTSWHCDHIIELQDGGEDKFENTQMLCQACHDYKNSQRRKITSMMTAIKNKITASDMDSMEPADKCKALKQIAKGESEYVDGELPW